MNRIVIIGNGFDLAHGLKTSYTDFMLWYLKQVIVETYSKKKYDDGLLKCSYNPDIVWGSTPQVTNDHFTKMTDVRDFMKGLSKSDFKLEFRSSYIRELLENMHEPRWVDIESSYYKFITGFFRKYKFNRENHIANTGVLADLKHFNEQFGLLKIRLEEYLIEQNDEILHIKIDDRLNEIFFGSVKGNEVQARFANKLRTSTPCAINSTYFVNFNYTSLVKKYVDAFRPEEKLDIKNIHGQLENEVNPIVFGYGDHFDGLYSEMEDANENEFLKQMKYFNYLSVQYYQEIMNFIELDDYQVVVLGHSLGVSDRTMLRRMFEDKNCASIKVFCHEYEKGKTDFKEKMMELSRHFSDKAVMLEKVVSFRPHLIFKVNAS